MPEHKPQDPLADEIRELIYYYIAPILIAVGIYAGGSGAITEGRRIYEGSSMLSPDKITNDSPPAPDYQGDLGLIFETAFGIGTGTGGIALRRRMREKD